MRRILFRRYAPAATGMLLGRNDSFFGDGIRSHHELVQDLPNKPAEAISNGPYGRLVAEPRQEAPENSLEMCAHASGRGVSRLAQEASHVFAAHAKELAATPTSAITCCAESMPKPEDRYFDLSASLTVVAQWLAPTPGPASGAQLVPGDESPREGGRECRRAPRRGCTAHRQNPVSGERRLRNGQ